MHVLVEAADIEVGGARDEFVHVSAAGFEHFLEQVQGLEDGALAGAVAAEKQGDGPQGDGLLGADALEVFDAYFCDWHRKRLLSSEG